jgi:hypothetical protein
LLEITAAPGGFFNGGRSRWTRFTDGVRRDKRSGKLRCGEEF